MSKNPSNEPGVLIHGSEVQTPNAPRPRRIILTLADARKRRWERELAAELAALEDGPEPPGAA